MNNNVETLKTMIQLSAGFNSETKKVVIKNDGQFVTVDKIVKKIKSADITNEEIQEVIKVKSAELAGYQIVME